MEEQVPPSQPPVNPPITPEQLEEMKVQARNLAIQQTLAQKRATLPPQPQVIYVRRNLTLAEIIVILALSCGLVTGVQFTWNVVNEFLPRLEINVK